MEWMCEEKMHPPGFTIKISTTEYRCRNINIAVTFTGAMITESRYEGDATIDYTVELKSSDVCSEAAKGSLNLKFLYFSIILTRNFNSVWLPTTILNQSCS